MKSKVVLTPEFVLSKVYGFTSFRGQQESVINSILSGHDTLVLQPTGFGKSLCFQIPALCLPGLAIVISPLISLMQNQVLALKQLGVNAEFMNSTLSSKECLEIKNNIEKTKLLYISPERFQVEDFQNWLLSLNISFFAIDEAHCVSRWGHDFRPDYIKLSQIKERFNKPIIALTATADLKTRVDIPAQLQMKDSNVFISSFDRPNIKLLATEKDKPKDQLLEFLEEFKGESGIVYCLSRKKVEETTAFLIKKGYDAVSYHAGMTQKNRSKNQEHFILKESVIAVATIAFGMGIDKPDVRFVVHLDMPQNLESYYQEIGRAGRDGEPSVALLLYSLQDFALRSQMIYQNQSAQKMADFGKLHEMLAYSDTLSCKRNYLMTYFGNHEVSCNNCVSCLTSEDKTEVTALAKAIVQTIKDTGQIYGIAYISLVLNGSNDKKVREQHKKLVTYGVCSDSDQLIKKTIRQLVVSQVLKIDLNSGYNNLLVLKSVSDPVFIKKNTKKLSKNTNPVYSDSDDFIQLKELRSKLAAENGVPPYLILHDKSLYEMAKHKPKNIKELKQIHGWGDKKIERYGTAFLDLIKNNL